MEATTTSPILQDSSLLCTCAQQVRLWLVVSNSSTRFEAKSKETTNYFKCNKMSDNHLIFSLILVLRSTQLIHSQLLTLQNIPQWRSIVSLTHLFCHFIPKLFSFVENLLISFVFNFSLIQMMA